MNRFYLFVTERAGARCEYCHAPEQVFNGVFEVEHIYPEMRGGTSDYDNLALACPACNSYKGSFISGSDPETDTDTRLFHPRQDIWDDHFHVNDANQMIGLTDVGRATIVRLRLNHDRQINARRHWRSNGIFP